MAEQWYLARKKEKLGPYSPEQLRQLAASCQLSPSDMLLREGAGKWVPASTLDWVFPSAAAPGSSNPAEVESSSSLGQVATTPTVTAALTQPTFTARAAQLLASSYRSLARQLPPGTSARWILSTAGAVTALLLVLTVVLFWSGRTGKHPTPQSHTLPGTADEVVSKDRDAANKPDNPARDGRSGIAVKDVNGQKVVSQLVLGSAAQKQGIRLGDTLLKVGTSREAMIAVGNKTVGEIHDLLLGPAGESLWISYQPQGAGGPLERSLVRQPPFEDPRPKTITWPKTGYVLHIPNQVIEQFPGSSRRYEFLDNQSKLMAFPEKHSGKRIAVVTNLLFPEVDSGWLRLRMFEDMDSPLGYVQRSQVARFFEAVVQNDPKKNRWVIMHFLLRTYRDSSRLYGELEEIMFLDQEAPDAYKPLIVEQIQPDWLVAKPPPANVRPAPPETKPVPLNPTPGTEVRADERTKEQIENAKKLDADVSENISRTAFLKKYPKAKLENFDPKDGFREYAVTSFPTQNYYAFVGEKIIAHKQYVVLGKESGDNLMRHLEEKLGKPDETDVDEEEKKEGFLKRHRWFIKEANVTIIGSIVKNQRFGPTFVRDVMNARNIEEVKAKLR